MAEIVNLNKLRKAKAKRVATEGAAVNAAKFGRSKAARHAEEARAEQARALLDAHRIVPAPDKA